MLRIIVQLISSQRLITSIQASNPNTPEAGKAFFPASFGIKVNADGGAVRRAASPSAVTNPNRQGAMQHV
jgi:hypothetical protein